MAGETYDQQVLNVHGKVVVLRSSRTGSLAGIDATARALREAGADLVLIISDDTTIEALDEDLMRAAGWVRA